MTFDYLNRYRLGAIARRALVARRLRSLNPHDLFVASYPKSGNTWLRFMLAHLFACKPVSFDDLRYYVPELEVFPSSKRYYSLPSGARLIKIHEPYRPRFRSGIYIMRDCRDVVVSYYFQQLRIGRYKGSFGSFCKHFASGTVDGYGRWDYHVTSWLDAARHNADAFLVVRYDDLLSNPFSTISTIVRFLSLDVSDESIRWAIDSSSASEMRKKEDAAKTIHRNGQPHIPFVRSAKSGGWRELLAGSDLEAIESLMRNVPAAYIPWD